MALFSAMALLLAVHISWSNAPSSETGLYFDSSNKFRILQLTDIHWREGGKSVQVADKFYGSLLDYSKPNLVILTGDIVVNKPVLEGWASVIKIFVKHNIPWLAISGNHDVGLGLSENDIANYIKTLPLNASKFNIVDSTPAGDGAYEIRTKVDNKSKARIYLFDYHTPYGKTETSWLKAASTNSSNESENLTTLVFRHIPLEEFSHFSGRKVIGANGERVSFTQHQDGLFKLLKERTSMSGFFAGHDHSNNSAFSYDGVCLAYGAVSGLDTYGKIFRGARVIELDAEKKGFTSWLLQSNGKEWHKFTFPNDF